MTDKNGYHAPNTTTLLPLRICIQYILSFYLTGALRHTKKHLYPPGVI